MKNLILNRPIVLCMLVVFTGCFSSRIEKTVTKELEPYSVDGPNYYKIMYIHLKDSTIIDVWTKNPRYFRNYKNMNNIIVYDTGKGEAFINVEDINYIIINKSSIDAGMTAATVGIVVVTLASVLAVLYFIALGNMH